MTPRVIYVVEVNGSPVDQGAYVEEQDALHVAEELRTLYDDAGPATHDVRVVRYVPETN